MTEVLVISLLFSAIILLLVVNIQMFHIKLFKAELEDSKRSITKYKTQSLEARLQVEGLKSMIGRLQKESMQIGVKKD